MMTRRQKHFSLDQDYAELLGCLESQFEISYTLGGSFDTPAVTRYQSFSVIPLLGKAKGPHTVSLENLVTFRETEIGNREVSQNDGSQLFMVDPWKNPPCIRFFPGGLFNDSVLIAGSFETGTDDNDLISLFNKLKKCMRMHYLRAKEDRRVVFLGKKSFEFLTEGVRLTESISSPRSLDFGIDMVTCDPT